MSCHSAGGQALLNPVHELDAADPYAGNPAAPDYRGRSHAWGVPAVNAAADSVGPDAGSPMEGYLEDGLIKCATCHEQHSNDAGAPYLRRLNNHDQMCKECHAPRNEGLGERGTHPVGFAYPAGQGEFPLPADVAPLFIKNDYVECMTCHAVHDADSGGANGGEGDGLLLRAANDEALCRTCHTDHIGHIPSDGWQPTCDDCHTVHDPDNENLALVAAIVYNQTLDLDLPVVFTARTGPNSFDDGDPSANDGICQVCHTVTDYHLHDGTGTPHYDGRACTACHLHSAGFMPVDPHHPLYGSVIPDPTNAPFGAPGDYYVCLSCHAVDTSSGTNQVLIERDCQVCHGLDPLPIMNSTVIPYPTDAAYGISHELYLTKRGPQRRRPGQ